MVTGANCAAVLLLCLAVVVGGTSSPARAHAVLVETQPADGTALASAPAEIVLRFNEPVTPVQFRVLDIDARRISGGADLKAESNTLRLPLPRDLARGTYVVSYRVTSSDSHPVSGSFMFSVGEAPPAQSFAAEEVQPGWTVVLAAFRALFVAGVLVTAGGALALWRLTGFERAAVLQSTRVITASTFVAALAGVLSVGVKGVQLAEGGAGGLLDPTVWRLGFLSSLGANVVVAVAGLAVTLAGLRNLDRRGGRACVGVGSLAAIAAFALTGHAASAAPRWLTAPALVVHVFCAAYWIGSLRPLVSALRAQMSDAAYHALVRFSGDAVVVVLSLLAAGVTLAVVQIRHWEMLSQTTYGLALLGKLGLVGLLFALAGYNRWRLTPRLRTTPAAARQLRATIAAEYALFACILALTAALTQIEPPRTAVDRDYYSLQSGRAGYTSTIAAAGYRVTLTISPARAGHNALALDIAQISGDPRAPREVSVELSLPNAGIEPMRRVATREDSGRFVYHGNELALAGRWHVDVRILIDDFTVQTAAFEVPVR